ncbi:MAG TPA: protein translocase subunit SecF [Dictyobacter sp.]|nr:protein translocase subunit SecF [Dictyobacter sp.]
MFNIVKHRYIFLLISLVIIVPGTLSLIFFGLNLGIDFVGGANIEIRPQRAISQTELDNLLKPFNLKNPQILYGTDTQNPGNKNAWITLNTQIDQGVETAITNDMTSKFNVKPNFINVPGANGKTYTIVTANGFSTAPTASAIKSALQKLPATSAKVAVNVTNVQVGSTNSTITIMTQSQVTTGNATNGQISLANMLGSFVQHGGPAFQVVTNSQVGASVAGSTVEMAFLAVLASSVAILLYIWFSFRKVSKPWRFGACALIALLHDVLVVLGIFSILGKLFNIQVDSLFVTALLTVIGFSVHDTIVVFDRVRENMQRRTSESFEEVVNASLVQTMARSLNTSLTVMFTLLAMTLFTAGLASNVHEFTLALLIGIFSGTYSSIFNASMLLVIWENGELGLWRLQKNREHMPAHRTQSEARELAHTRG